MNPLPVLRATLARNPFTVVLFTLLVAVTVALGIAISVQERALRQGSARAADKFDLIVAAPGSQTDILFASVFLRPTAVELLPGPVAHRVLTDPSARFAAPIAFGDSHGNSPVVGTSPAFVTHLGGGALAEGRVFTSRNEAVVGALVPAKMGAALEIRHGDADDLSGGMDADSFAAEDEHGHEGHSQSDHAQDEQGHTDHGHGEEGHGEEGHDEHAQADDGRADDGHGAGDHGHLHDDVVVTGRLPATGTPWDRAVIVPVEYIWLSHAMGTGHPAGDERIGPPWDPALLPGLPAIVVQPESVAAAYGLRSRYRDAETMAFFPAETLVDLYQVMGDAARIMSALTMAAQVLVVAAILTGLLAVLDLQRRRFAVLRAQGAPAVFIFLVVWLYVGAMILTGAVLGLPLGWLGSSIVSDLIAQETGVAMRAQLGLREVGMVAGLVGLGLVLAVLPGLRLYHMSPLDGLK
ncbi:FtsX-like permease family protein [Gemmobacter serpentinus]|uniref:FtsX-like permease family protein n=1 Tax=Gemmobacter serpentinus TaxID=2652247 RepID=UPI0018657E2D|nr:ABC transporter permease [Gemmobacter serpentinus]